MTQKKDQLKKQVWLFAFISRFLDVYVFAVFLPCFCCFLLSVFVALFSKFYHFVDFQCKLVVLIHKPVDH